MSDVTSFQSGKMQELCQLKSGTTCAFPVLLCLFSPTHPPGSGGKGLGEVLRLKHGCARCAKHYDAHSVVGRLNCCNAILLLS